MTDRPRPRARARLVAVPLGDRAVGHREPHQRAGHPGAVGRRRSSSSCRRTPAAPCRCCAGRCRSPWCSTRWSPSACARGSSTGCTAGRSPARPSTRAPAGSPGPGRWSRSPASRPSTSPAACCSSCSGWPRSRCFTASSPGHRAHLAPRARRRPAGRRRPRRPGGAGPGPGHVTGPPSPRRRTSPRIVLVHTATFRQARQFVPFAHPGAGRASGWAAGRWTVVGARRRRHPAVPGDGGAVLVAVQLPGRPDVRRRHPRAGVPLRAHRAQRPDPRRRDRGAADAPAARPGPRADRRRRGRGRRGKDEELLIDGVTARRGRPAADGGADQARPRAGPAADDVDGAGQPEPEPEEEFARFDNRWLLYAPLVGGYLAVPLAAVGALSRVVDELPGRLLPDVDGPASGRPVVAVLVAGRGAGAAGRGRGGRRGGRQLALPPGAPRRLARRRPRAAHPAAHRAGDRPDPRGRGGRRGRHAAGRGGAGERPGHRPRRRPAPRPAAAARAARRGGAAQPPAGRRPRPAHAPPRRRPGAGGSRGPWPPGCS